MHSSHHFYVHAYFCILLPHVTVNTILFNKLKLVLECLLKTQAQIGEDSIKTIYYINSLFCVRQCFV